MSAGRESSRVERDSASLAQPSLVGRDEELRRLTDALEGLPVRGYGLVLRGEAGIGKSALLDAARGLAEDRGVRVLHTAGVASESELPFSGLHRLLRPVLDGVGELPLAHRSALLAALGVEGDDAGDPFLVAMATLEVLAGKATDRSLLVIADDLHWLDAPSRDAIAFVGRRIEADPIVLLVGLRDGYDEEVGELGLAERVLQPLADTDAAAVLDARAPGLDVALRGRVLTEAAGNPLALMELPTDAGEWPAGGGASPLTARLERAFSARLRDIPAETRVLLLIAAADESLAISEILAGGEIILGRECGLSLVQPALEAGLVMPVGGALQFRHPLMRSAIYYAAEVSQRNATHAALAQVLGDRPDRRAWHRAAAALGPDDSIAKDVEDMAWRAHQRGAVLDAATLLGRAAELSEDPDDRARRLLKAGELAFQVGRAELVRRYVEEARGLNLGALDQARVEWLSEIFHDGVPGDPDRVLALVALADQARSDDPDLALTLLLAAGLRSWWGDPGEAVREQVVTALERLPFDHADSRVLQIVGLAQPISRCASVMAALATAAPPGDDGETLLRLGMAAHCVGDWERSIRILRAATESLRADGRLGLLTHAMVALAQGAIMACDWPVARSVAAEIEVIARETNQQLWLTGALVAQCAVAGVRGDEQAAEAYGAEAERLIHLTQSSNLLCVLQNARGVTALAAGRPEEAYTYLARMFDPTDPSYHYRESYLAVANLADAALASGRREEVARLVVELTERAEPTVERAMLVGLHYARAVLADDDHAEAEFAAALGAIGPRWAFNRARLNLAYGSWLRRHRRVAESREPLRAAREAFDVLDVPAWSDRTRGELRASGETSRARRPEAWAELSPQELQIAQLAATGLSNREIGQRLYLSHRTISSHLYRTFPKLGISSRGQLAGVLPPRSPADAEPKLAPAST